MTILKSFLSLLVASSFAWAQGKSTYAPPYCSNSPSNRGCWSGGYNIDTDTDLTFPTTGRTIYQTLEITNTTCDPDGDGARLCVRVNGQFPGPAIRASWGDTLVITVKNLLQDNGTSVHYHGIRQLNSPGSDGTNGISQCAIAPGDAANYTFHATHYGTGWFHSHLSMQYGDGLLGPIIIDGPATANYDIDLGPYIFTEAFGELTAWQAGARANINLQKFGALPHGTAILINGTNSNTNIRTTHDIVTVYPGKRYRLRLINGSVNTYVRVSLDHHILTVISADFVPVKPFDTKWLLLAVGQRYDAIIHTDQKSGSFWFRANVPPLCFSRTDSNATAIWTYGTLAPNELPTTSPWPDEPGTCDETKFSSYWDTKVPAAPLVNTLVANRTYGTVADGRRIVVWVLNNPIYANYSDPTIGYVMRGDTNYPKVFNTIDAAPHGEWNYWLIINDPRQSPGFAIYHPIHLHGHNFFVIGSGSGPFHEATAELNWDSPVRRDTTSLPGAGWLALAFRSDNPGCWLLHCHTVFHIGEGFGAQFVESPRQMTIPDKPAFERTCDNWKQYARKQDYSVIVESGL